MASTSNSTFALSPNQQETLATARRILDTHMRSVIPASRCTGRSESGHHIYSPDHCEHDMLIFASLFSLLWEKILKDKAGLKFLLQDRRDAFRVFTHKSTDQSAFDIFRELKKKGHIDISPSTTKPILPKAPGNPTTEVDLLWNLFRTLRNGLNGHFNYKFVNLSTADYFIELGKNHKHPTESYLVVPEEGPNNYSIYIIDFLPEKHGARKSTGKGGSKRAAKKRSTGGWLEPTGQSRYIKARFAGLRYWMHCFLAMLTDSTVKYDVFGNNLDEVIATALTN